MTKDHIQVVYDGLSKVWRSVHVRYPHEHFVSRSLGEAFLQSMRSLDPDKVLEYYYDSGRERTVKDIYHDAVMVAKSLQRLDIRKDDVVVLYADNNPMVSALTFGCYLVGAVVNFFEVNLERDHINYVLKTLQPAVIIYEEAWKQRLWRSLEHNKLGSLKHLISIEDVRGELLHPMSASEIEHFHGNPHIDPQHDVASLVLTSGTTGFPKVVQLSHAQMLHGLAIWWQTPDNSELPGPESVLFSFSPLRWISQIEVMLQSAILGAKRICVTGAAEGAYGRDIIRKTGITHFFTAPSIFQQILEATDHGDTDSLSSLKIVLLGGEPSSPELMGLARRRAPNCKAYFCYGMTEVSTCITNDEAINGGKILPGYELMVLDEKHEPVGPNMAGQLCIRTPFPFLGYKNVDNSQYCLPNGFFINGDYGFVDENNNLHMQSRYKDLVRNQGVIIVPHNVEEVVEALPEVHMARFTGYRKAAGDTGDTGALFVMLHPNVLTTHDELRKKIVRLLKAKLSHAQVAIIHDLHFIDKLPFTSCGKVDRVALRRHAAQM